MRTLLVLLMLGALGASLVPLKGTFSTFIDGGSGGGSLTADIPPGYCPPTEPGQPQDDRTGRGCGTGGNDQNGGGSGGAPGPG